MKCENETKPKQHASFHHSFFANWLKRFPFLKKSIIVRIVAKIRSEKDTIYISFLASEIQPGISNKVIIGFLGRTVLDRCFTTQKENEQSNASLRYFKHLFPLFQWPACKLAKPSTCIAKCVTTVNKIYIFYIM